MPRTSKKKTNQPPKTKDVFKLFRWYKKKWDRQQKQWDKQQKEWDKRDKEKRKLAKRSGATQKQAQVKAQRKSKPKRKVALQ